MSSTERSALFQQLVMLDARRQAVAAQRPLSNTSLISLRAKICLDWTQESNAIEGNTLTLIETKVVLEHGVTVAGKSLREHLEVMSHASAIDYVYQLVGEGEPITEWDIKSLHQLVFKPIDATHAGRYRDDNVMISGAAFIPPDALHVPTEMSGMMTWLASDSARLLHPIERAAELHARFIEIHPFIDGNGRTGRLLLNLSLLKDGYPIAVVKAADRLNYYQSLESWCVNKDITPFAHQVATLVGNTVGLYEELLGSPSVALSVSGDRINTADLALHAIKARFDGVFDDPALMACGALSPSAQDDVQWILANHATIFQGFDRSLLTAPVLDEDNDHEPQ